MATSRFVGIVNFSGLLAQSTVILSAACQQLVLLHLSYERRTAWRKAIPRLIGLGVVLLGMITLFSAATSIGERPTDFALTKAQYYPAYLTIYLVGHAANQIDIGIMGWRYARMAPTPWLRRGLRLVAVSMPFAMIYTGCRVADIIAGQFGVTGHPWEPVAQIAIAGTVLKTVGWTMPDWGRYLTTAYEWFDRHRAYREITPFHRDVTSHLPEVVLDLGQEADLRTRLYRCLVEIRDAQWALRTWMAPSVATLATQRGEAAGLNGIDLAAAVEAAQLKAALQAKIEQKQPTTHVTNPRIAEPEDLAAELSFQRKLARAFTASDHASPAVAHTPHTPEPAKKDA
ncbi:hypothetical protein J1792_32455 [Streptomyces triculaminicus]|uniref:DUF6545 domain-containing protein n=1 Tax=Streptomyces triculaminicus TaxID=2816232 RepID=A0A939FTW5_9ACTN|nr:hypothetical protein [Streptomyces triculaminicus]